MQSSRIGMASTVILFFFGGLAAGRRPTMPRQNGRGCEREDRSKEATLETGFEVRSFDAAIPLDDIPALPRYPLYIILDNLRSAFNVGPIFRTCDALGAAGSTCAGIPPARPMSSSKRRRSVPSIMSRGKNLRPHLKRCAP